MNNQNQQTLEEKVSVLVDALNKGIITLDDAAAAITDIAVGNAKVEAVVRILLSPTTNVDRELDLFKHQ